MFKWCAELSEARRPPTAFSSARRGARGTRAARPPVAEYVTADPVKSLTEWSLSSRARVIAKPFVLM
jgi:hypothetical protein